jgi:hypothetical protein
MASARTALERRDLDGARASLERVLAREAANKQARLALVDVLIRMARWADAESQARILSNQFPEETEPIYLLAQVALRRGDPACASELAGRCIKRGDKRPEIYKVLALAEYLLSVSSISSNVFFKPAALTLRMTASHSLQTMSAQSPWMTPFRQPQHSGSPNSECGRKVPRTFS